MHSELSAHRVSFAYGNHPVLHEVSLSLPAGAMLALAGPNGSGKTTLLRLLSGALRPARGKVTLNGIDLHALSARRRARQIAVVSQRAEPGLLFPVRELVAMGRAPYMGLFRPSTPSDQGAVQDALERTGSVALADRRFAELSGGEQQRVLVAMALAQEPRFLLLDEPTVHLDLHYQYELLELLADLRKKERIGILAIMHDLNLAALYFDQLALMRQGEVVAAGTPDEILYDPGNLAVFGAPLDVIPHPSAHLPQVLLNRSRIESDN